MADELWSWVRVINALLALLVFGLLIAGATARWELVPTRLRRIIPWVVITYGIIAYGSVEIWRADVYVEPGFRVGLMTINLMGLIVALLWGIGDKTYYTPRSKKQFIAPEETGP